MTEEEAAWFRAVMNGQFLLQGFRNVDLRRLLMPQAASDSRRRRQQSGQVTRWLRLLRAHGLIRKVSRTRYYRVTDKGHEHDSRRLTLRRESLREEELAAATRAVAVESNLARGHPRRACISSPPPLSRFFSAAPRPGCFHASMLIDLK